jgi:CTP synthase (UTP-ammonia lyase)
VCVIELGKFQLVSTGKRASLAIAANVNIGGTVGDIESAPFIHSLCQLQRRAGKGNFVQILVSFVPVVGEQKTKPTQRAVSDSRSAGLNPDLVYYNPAARWLGVLS